VLDRFDVRPRNWAALIDWLSCGNQQKVFVGRWLETGAQLFIMEEPTVGVDIGAKGVIHRMLCDLAAEGAGVLVVSSDFEEAVTLCDRALVVGRGVITADLEGPGLTLESLLTRSSKAAEPAAPAHWLEKGMSDSTLQRSAPAPSAPRASSATVSNLPANYGLLFVFLLIMLVFGLLRPSSFFQRHEPQCVLVSQSVTAILALAPMVPLATNNSIFRSAITSAWRRC
jgi:energy-coupling factor transporter ATP-binding protein EcfA2